MLQKIKELIFNKPIEIAIAICLIMGSLSIGNYLGSFGKQTQIDEYREQVEEFQNRVSEVMEYSDSLRLYQDMLSDSIDSLERERIQSEENANRYRQVNDRLERRLDSLRSSINLDSVPEPVVEYISTLEIRIDTLSAEVTSLRGALSVSNSQLLVWETKFSTEQQRADSLQVVINTFPDDVPDPDRLFGIIRLPSRTTSFIVGGAVGVITGITFASNF